MIRLVNDTTWLVIYNNEPRYGGSPSIFTHVIDSEKKLVQVFWPVTYFPSDSYREIKDYSLDLRRNYVDTYENLGDPQSYSYEGHTWNNFYHRKVSGTITNLPKTFPQKLLADVGYTGWTNVATGTGMINPTFIKFNESKWWGYTELRPASYYPSIYIHQVWMRYWNPKTGIVRVASVRWYTNMDGNRCDAYGSKLPADKLSCTFRNDGTGAYWIRERFAGQRWQFANYSAGLYNPVYETTEYSMTIYDSDTLASVFQRFCALCRFTDRMVIVPPKTWYYLDSVGGRSFTGRAIKPDLRQPNWDAMFPDTKHMVYWPQIAALAYQNLGMTSINGIANVSELFEMGSAITGFLKTVEDLPIKRAKAAAGLFLSVHYGFKLTVLDAIELRKTLAKYAEKRSSLSKCTGQMRWERSGNYYTATYQVFYDEFANLKSSLDQILEISDFVLSTENWWDMVPYSFVVDWFVGVGDVLQALDNFYNLQNKHEIICAGRSIKAERVLKPSSIGITDEAITSDLKACTFTRYYNKHLILPSILPDVTVNPFNHLIEAAALIISRK